METGQAVQKKESPVYEELKMIDDRLIELGKTSDNLHGRLSNILSEQTPSEASDSTKAHC